MEEDLIEKISPAIMYSFFTMLGLILLAVVIHYFIFFVDVVNDFVEKIKKKKRQIKENEELLLKETEPLRKAIDQDLKDLAKAQTNPEFVKRFNESIGRAVRENIKKRGMSNARILTGDCSNLHGDRSDLWGNVKDLYGDCSGIWGDCSGLWGDCTGLKGCCTGLVGYCVEQLKE